MRDLFTRRMSIRLTLLAATFLGGAAQAQTLEQALAKAYETNPQILAARASLRATDENVAQAQAGWRPTVTVSASAGFQHYATNPDRQTKDQYLQPRQAQLSVTQPLYRGGGTEAGIKRSKQEIYAARARLFVTEQDVLLNATQAYLDTLRDGATLELNINNERVLTRQLEATRDRFRVGEVTRTDVAQSESRLALANANRQTAEGNLNATKTRYRQLIGQLPGRLVAPRPPRGLPQNNEQLQQMALQENPLVSAARFDERAAFFRVREAFAQLLPSVSLVGTLSRARETQLVQRGLTNTDSVTLQASVPLYEAGQTYSRIRQLKQTQSQAMATIDVQARQVIQNASAAWEAMSSSRARVQSFAAQIRSADIALEGVRQEANVGTRTTLDVLDAEQEVLQAKVNLVSAQRDELFTQFQALAALGRMTAQKMALPVQYYDHEANFRDVNGRWIGFGILPIEGAAE